MRAAGVGQAEELAHLVEGLARGVVLRLAEQAVAAGGGDLDEHRVPAADDEADAGAHAFRGAKERREQVALQVVDGEPGFAEADGEALGGGGAEHERGGQAGAARRGEGVHIFQGDPGGGEGAPDDGPERAEMIARGDFGDDAAGGGVEGDLRGDFAGQELLAAQERDGGFIARRLDRQHQPRGARLHYLADARFGGAVFSA